LIRTRWISISLRRKFTGKDFSAPGRKRKKRCVSSRFVYGKKTGGGNFGSFPEAAALAGMITHFSIVLMVQGFLPEFFTVMTGRGGQQLRRRKRRPCFYFA
jgi:hypothetical protein